MDSNFDVHNGDHFTDGTELGQPGDHHKALLRHPDESPDYAETWCNLGYRYLLTGHLADARRSLLNAARCNTRLPQVWNNLGNVALFQGRVRSAVSNFRKALAVDPSFVSARYNLLLALHHLPAVPPEVILSESRSWEESFRDQPATDQTWPVPPHPDRRLRVGIVSSDLHFHPVAFFLEPLLRGHDRRVMEVICFADVARPDKMTRNLTELTDGWRDTSALSNRDLADQIRRDRVDILIDVGGHTNGDRLGLFCLRPAPLQATWLGFPGTTGLSVIDYRLTDSVADPPGISEKHYSEHLLRLPGGFLCYAPVIATPPVSQPPCLQNGFITFGSFNNYCKINREVLLAWIRLLDAVPEARLYLKNRSLDDGETRDRLVRIFRRLGGNLERLILEGQTGSFVEHLDCYHRVDIALDTFPYNGTITTCEALWMGVPVVTLAGNRHSARVGASILTNAGIERCVATSLEEYHELAVGWASDIDRLAGTRRDLRERLMASPLCDGTRFSSELQDVFRSIWKRWCASSLSQGVNPFSICHQEGLDLLNAGDCAAAEARFRIALEYDAESAMVWSDLGIAVFRQGRWFESLEYFRKAVALDPRHARGWTNLGNALRECGRNQEAVDACRLALDIDPNLPEGRTNLGMALLAMHEYDAGSTMFLEEAYASPDSFEGWSRAGEACTEAGMPAKAVSCFRKALKLKHDDPAVLLRMGHALQGLCHEESALRLFRKALRDGPADPAVHSALLMSLNYLPAVSQAEIRQETLRWGRWHGIALPYCGEIDASEERKIRIGYVSADLHRHPVGTFLLAALVSADRDRFELYCYSNSYREDEVTAELQKAVDGWRMIAGLTDRQAYDIIRHDHIDILVDLSGHSAGNRLPLFARKPAPVQVSWLGYCHTTGSEGMDFLISDADTVPEGEEEFYSEQIIRLPHSRFCYQAPRFVPDVEPLPALENGYVTFGSFNNLVKVNDTVLRLWAGVLLAVPHSRLVMKGKALRSREVRRRFRAVLARHGVASERVEFREGSPHFFMMAEYGDIDIALDTFPFTGGLTTCEALWMGVPVVTLTGTTPISRQSASFLRLIGLEKLVARDGEEFVRKAAELASSLPELAGLRGRMRETMSASPLCDRERFDRDVEAAYRDIWRRGSEQPAGARDLTAMVDAACAAAAECFDKGMVTQAETVYREILERFSEHVGALHGLGVIACRKGQAGEGMALLEKAAGLKPDRLDAYFTLAGFYRNAGRLSEAESCLRQLLQQDPSSAKVKTELGGILYRQGRIDEAIEQYRQVIGLSPDNDAARCSLLLVLNYSSVATVDEIFKEHRSWGSCQERAARPFRLWNVATNEQKRLKIGYVTADFGHHPVGYFMLNPVRFRDRNRVEIFCYSNRPADDDLTGYFREQCDCWRPIHGLSDDQVARQIRRDGIDILVDLSGHTRGHRLSLFARRPAPVQVSWLGYPNTTGLSRIDYRLTDAIADPPGIADDLHTERLVRLPGGFLSYFPPLDAPDVSPLPALVNGYLTFGCFNNLAKITRDVIAVWSRLLMKLPGSRLILKRSTFTDLATVERYRTMFTECGVEPSRVDLLASTEGLTEHLKIYDAVDIALDPFPYNGTTTTCEALWMGVPVIALQGDRHAGRVGASILSRVGLDGFIAEDIEEYLSHLVVLSRNLDRLAFLRETLRDRMAASPLCDGQGFCRILENAYREMWRSWCRSPEAAAARTAGLSS